MTQALEIKAAITADDAGEITGIAWPFGTADRVGDMIEKGAFASAMLPVPMLFGHNPNDPVGVWDSVEETDTGLQVKGRLLVADVTRAREVHALVASGAVGGLSIGFSTKKAAPPLRRRSHDLRTRSCRNFPCDGPGSSRRPDHEPESRSERHCDRRGHQPRRCGAQALKRK
ncbi:HK97 family phage prohead protease [Jiella marina]